ncbi:MAG: LysM peptidoglycan-binding domain-containing protein [Deltaproteobacteria bacterium]
MIRLNKRTYDRVVAELVYTNDIRKLVDRFSVDRIFYFNILKDISDGKRSPNYNLLKKIARRKKLNENFIIEQAKSVLNFYVPYHQAELTNYYKILNVGYDATDEEIRRSWIELMKSHHPDKAGPDRLDEAKKINEAYAVLGNMEKRDAYDRRYLPFIPVMVSDGGLNKNFYYGASVVFLLIVIVYAAGSGLLFGSKEEKEMFAKKIEQPGLPNAAYRGDPMESVIAENERESLRTDEKRDSAPPGIAEEDITDFLSSRNIDDKFESEETADDEDIVAEMPESSESESDTVGSEVITIDEDVIAKVLEAADDEEIAEDLPVESLNEPVTAEPDTGAETKEESETLAAVDEKEEPEKETEEEDAGDKLASLLSVQDTGDININEPGDPAEEVAVINKGTDKEEPPGAVRLYKVQNGDSLWTIARKFDTTTDELSRLNNLSENKIKPGQELIVSGGALPSIEVAKEPSTEVAVINNDTDKEEPPGAVRLYEVRNGDSLWTIARKFDTTTDELDRLNQLSGKKIRPGQELIISGPALPRVATRIEPGQKETAKKKEDPALPAAEAVKDSPPRTPAEKKEAVKGYAPVLSATAVSVGNQNIANPYRTAPEPDQNSLYSFVSEYASAYKTRDVGKIESLFAPDAVENGRSISSVIDTYKSNFASLDIISYDIKVNNVNLREKIGYVRGDFYIKFKDQRTGTMKNSRGTIDWQLSWKGGTWEITNLSYKIEKTDTIGG